MNQGLLNIGVDQNDAPKGFYAVPLAELPQDQGNFCRQCDWRKTCNDPQTDPLASGHRCKGHAVISSKDGEIYQRNDETSVVFKKRKETK